MANSTSSTLFAPKAPVVPAAPAPSTPVKSTTVSHPDGTTVATTYHAPASTGLVGSMVGASAPVSPENTAPTQTTGTQHPGDPGFTPIAPNKTQTATAEYNSDGTYAGTLPAGSTANNATPGPTTFGGIVGGLTTAAQNGSGVANTAANGLLQAPNQNQVLGDKAAQIGESYGKQIAQAGTQGAEFGAGQLTGMGTSPVASGNAAVTAQTTAAEQQALATGEQAALQGNAQQLTAQNQGQAGLTNAGSIGNTSQSNVQSGLASAAGYAQPSPTAQGQTTYDPLTNSFSGGSYGTNLQTVVQAIKSGNMGYTNGVNSLSGLSPTAKADVLAALGPNFDTVASDANTSARGQNITTGGTTGTSTAAQGYSGAAQTYTAYQGANTAAESQAKQVQSILGSTGLNSGVPDYNKAINSLSGRLGATNVAQLSTALTELQNMYSQILSVGGTTPSGSESQALQVLNPNSSAAQINASIQQLQQASYNRGTGLYSQLQTYSNNLGQGGSTGNAAGGGWGSLGD